MCIRDRPIPVITAEEGLEALDVGITFFFFFYIEIVKFSFHKPVMFIFLFLSVL